LLSDSNVRDDLATLLLVVSLLLLHEEDENLPEHLDEVNEKVERVSDEVLVSVPGLPDDQLSVEHDEPAEHRQSDPDVSLEEHLRSEENVDESQPDEG